LNRLKRSSGAKSRLGKAQGITGKEKTTASEKESRRKGDVNLKNKRRTHVQTKRNNWDSQIQGFTGS